MPMVGGNTRKYAFNIMNEVCEMQLVYSQIKVTDLES